MRYHFQFASIRSVRIELIAETPAEKTLLNQIGNEKTNQKEINELYRTGLENYNSNTTLLKVRFIDFPKVALCNFTIKEKAAETQPVNHKQLGQLLLDI